MANKDKKKNGSTGPIIRKMQIKARNEISHTNQNDYYQKDKKKLYDKDGMKEHCW
jgi:hypothetical protein